MNIKIPYTWLLEYLDTKATPRQIAQYLSLCGPSVEKIETIENEPVFEIEVTSNRVDCMSVAGIAREAAAILPQFGIPASYKPYLPIDIPTAKTNLPLIIQNDPQLCQRIMAIVLNVSISESTPLVKKRLRQIGMRPLNSIVDVTNYVMTEIGHPLHVFDYDKIASHKLVLRLSCKGETAISFDHKKYLLAGGDIVIDDGSGQIVDLPGIIGTANSVVSASTKRVIFFLETNNHLRIRQTSMTHGIRTVAATLNEKAVDPELATLGFNRGLKQFLQALGARPASTLIDLFPGKPKSKTITVRHRLLEQRTGVPLTSTQVSTILNTLGFATVCDQNQYRIQIPSWRQNDVSIPEDIVEEVARIYGYHQIPSVLPMIKPAISTFDRRFYWEHKLKDALRYAGHTECYTYSLVSRKMIIDAGLDPAAHLRLKNPLSAEWEYLRTVLLPSLMTVFRQNEPRTDRLSLFELSHIYRPQVKDLPQEEMHLALVTDKTELEIQAMLVSVLSVLGQKPRFQPASHPSIKGNGLYLGKKLIGMIGRPAGGYRKNWATSRPVVVAEINAEILLGSAGVSYHFRPIATFSPIIEDLTFEIPSGQADAQLAEELYALDPTISQFAIKDRYRNRVTFSVCYLSHEKQLSGKDAVGLRRRIVTYLYGKYRYQLVGKI